MYIKLLLLNEFQSSFCESDALVVSRVGDSNFTDGVRHCGPRSFTAVSRTNKMNIMFVAKLHSRGGRFMCSVGAKRVDFWMPDIVKNSQYCECGNQNKVKSAPLFVRITKHV